MDEQKKGIQEPKKRSKRPLDKDITQQTLPALKPVLEPIWVVLIFLAIGTVLVPIGGVCIYYGYKAVEVSARYDDSCLQQYSTNMDRQAYLWQNGANDTALSCNIIVNVTQDMVAPIYVYYELNGFYQNHRRYVKSRSDAQLAGGHTLDGACAPEDNLGGNSSLPINPCGLIAWSFFNDSYTVQTTRLGDVPISSKGIALPSDIKNGFASYNATNFNPNVDSLRGGNNLTGTLKSNERFIVWMRLAAMPHFRKLWGVIGTDLHAGDVLTISVINRYNTYSFDGQKSFVLSTTTWLGGRNPFLGVAYVVTGGVSFLLSILYLMVRLLRPRKFADAGALSFNLQAH